MCLLRKLAAAMVAAVLAAIMVAGPLATPPAMAEEARIEPVVGDDGLYHQTWFLNSFMDLREDLAASHAEGKRFAIVFEQAGCPYCRDMHTINLADPALNAWIRERYNILQVNLWGDREVTDFDGTTMAEKDLASRYAVNFTPTILFFPEDPAEVEGRSGPQVEVSRMPGYFRPFHFTAMFEYVWDKRYAKGQPFQRYILEKAAAETGSAPSQR